MTQAILAAVVLTLNEAQHIQACVESLAWADKVVVVDSHSSDDTRRLAKEAGADVVERTFENYAQQRNAALAAVSADWVMFVDADERATPALAQEVLTVVATGSRSGWWIPRHNHIFGHRMRATGWYPDYQLRLMRRETAHYDEDRHVHELVVIDGETGHLTHPLIHYNYETLRCLTKKWRRYLDYDVDVLMASGAAPRLHTPLAQGLRHVWWRFVTLQGWRDTVWGLLLSGLMGYYEMVKYLRVRRALRSTHCSGSASQGSDG